MGSEHRRDPRVSSYAKAILVDPPAPGYVRDLSRTGCQIAFMQPVPAAIGDLLVLRVIAEHDPSITPFPLKLRVRWLKQDDIWFAVGAQIEPFEDPGALASFNKLVSYYSGAGA
jgi:hypothetical protein